MRRRFTRFRDPENFKHNLTLVDALKAVAEKKGITPAQLCIAWVGSLGPKVIPLPGSSCVSSRFDAEAVADLDARIYAGTLSALSGIPLQLTMY